MKEMENVSSNIHPTHLTDIVSRQITLNSTITYFDTLFHVSVIFNWITFQNDMCTTQYNWNDANTLRIQEESGVCYTAAECGEQGGVAKSHCAAGYGSCCVCK